MQRAPLSVPWAAAPSGRGLGAAVRAGIARAAACLLVAPLLVAGWLAPGGVAAARDGVAAGPPAALRPCLAARNGIGGPADPVAARRCLWQAAEAGEPAAMFLLAQMLGDGDGGARDDAAARAWLERAAERDYPEALQALALAEPDPVRSDGLMRAAAHALAHRAHEMEGMRPAVRRD